MQALEAGASDFQVEDGVFEIYTEPDDFDTVKENLQKEGFTFLEAEVQMIPQTYTALTNEEDIKNMEKMLEVMEEHRFLKKVWLIGPPGETLRQIPAAFGERLTGISEMESVREDTMDQMVAQLGQYPVYLSIDKDVLSVEESPTNWDQGSMMLETLLKWLKLLAGKTQIIGADVCGEVSENGSFMSLEAFCRKNDRVNRRLAETLQGCMRQAVLP